MVKKKEFTLSLFIFRRDLRLNDNTGLIEALKKSMNVIPAFIIDSRQVEENSYKSQNALQFMSESLDDLDYQLKNKGGRLYYFYGHPDEIVARLIQQKKIEAVFVNHDYTPFSVQRDQALNMICSKKKVGFYQFHDALLLDPEKSLKKNGEPYTIFTPFYKKNSVVSVPLPHKNMMKNYFSGSLDGSIESQKKITCKPSNEYFIHGGRQECLKILKNIDKYSSYAKTKDLPHQPTTFLSAHNKFGTCSIREVYHAIHDGLGQQHGLLRQLYWRDFFTIIAFYFPRVFGHAFREKYDTISWSQNVQLFKKWCEGKTGFPIIDAGMRELNQTGFMHNRVRMIVASFLVKDLHLDWRWGEKYFAQKLVDYDPAVNNGNWQWAASTGCDAQPYFRIFNPWMQQKKFDLTCVYSKRWVPELRVLTPHEIHRLEKVRPAKLIDYPEPIVDHHAASIFAKKMFKRVS